MAATLNHFVGSFVDDAAVNAYLTAHSWTAEEGWIYYNSTATELRWWDGSAWVGPGGAATDPNAIHVNASAEISGIAPKGAPIAADLIVIEDSIAGNAKKSAQVGNLPVPSHALGTAHSVDTLANLNAKVSDATLDDSSATRTPSLHAASHLSAGGDSIKLDDLATPDNNTDLDSSLTEHGLLLKLGGGTVNYLRADGTWASPPGGTTTDKHTAKIIVGNGPNGDTIADCDFLDTGDGVGVQTALAAAGTGADVYMRPGAYNLGVGAAVAPLIVPPSVRLRGAGRLHSKVTTKNAGDQGAFLLGADSILEDVGIDVGLPIGACLGSPFVIRLNGARALCDRVAVDFLGVWTGVEAALTVLRACFEVGIAGSSSPTDCLLDDCWAGQHTGVPSMITLGLAPGNEMACFAVRTSGTPAWFSAQLLKAQSNGGDWSAIIETKSKIMLSMFYDAVRMGVIVSGTGTVGSTIGDNHILSNFGGVGDERGILLDSTTLCGIESNFIGVDTPVVGQEAIELLGSDYNAIKGNRGLGGLIGAVALDATSDDNEVIGNLFSGSAYTDAGARNDVVHNK